MSIKNNGKNNQNQINTIRRNKQYNKRRTSWIQSKKKVKRQTVPTDPNNDTGKKQNTSLCVRIHGFGKGLRQSLAQRPAPYHGPTQHPHIFQRFISSFLSNRHTLTKRNHHIQTHQNQRWGTTMIVIQPNTLHHLCSKSPKTTTNSTLSQLADDIKTYSTSKDITQLQNKLQKSLNRIAAFCGKSRISLNENKTTELIITGRVHRGIHPFTPNTQETNPNH